MWKQIFKRHRFVLIVVVIFFVVVAFLDKNNLRENWELRQKIEDLEDQKDFYLKKIEEDSLVLENLRNAEFLEKYARENFYMKRAGEEIYIVR